MLAEDVGVEPTHNRVKADCVPVSPIFIISSSFRSANRLSDLSVKRISMPMVFCNGIAPLSFPPYRQENVFLLN